MAWFVYKIAPIDFGWHGLETVRQAAARIGGLEVSLMLDTMGAPNDSEMTMDDVGLEAFLDSYRSAWAEAGLRKDDLRQEPVAFWIPVEDSFACGFVFKEDNNGTTHIVSPVPLPHLD